MLCTHIFRAKHTSTLYPKVRYKRVRYNEIILYVDDTALVALNAADL